MSTTTRSVDDYSLLDPAVQDDPFEFYELLQEERPVYKMPETGFFVVTRYDDVRKVVADYKTFSNDLVREKEFQKERYQIHADVLADGGWPLMQTLQRTDPPVHGRYRRLLDKVFTPKQVQQLKPRIDAIVNELIDSFIDKGECEFVHDFALLLPGQLIAEQIGLGNDVLTFKKWVDAMFATGMAILSEDEVRKNAEIELEAQLQPGTQAARDAVFAGLNALRTAGAAIGGVTAGSLITVAPMAGPAPTTQDAAIDLLYKERAYWLWLTGHRLGDLRRLIRVYKRDSEAVFPTGTLTLPLEGTYGTGTAVTIPFSERNNPKFKGCLEGK